MESTQNALTPTKEEMIETLKTDYNISKSLIREWQKNNRLAYNYHSITNTVGSSAAYKYLHFVGSCEYIKFRSLLIDKDRILKNLHFASMQQIEVEVDNLERFLSELSDFLKETVSETKRYKKFAYKMYMSASSPITYTTFPNFRSVRDKWYREKLQNKPFLTLEDLAGEKAHLQKIYDFVYNSKERLGWLESLK